MSLLIVHLPVITVVLCFLQSLDVDATFELLHCRRWFVHGSVSDQVSLSLSLKTLYLLVFTFGFCSTVLTDTPIHQEHFLGSEHVGLSKIVKF